LKIIQVKNKYRKKVILYLTFGLFFQILVFSSVINCLASANSSQELNKHWPTNEWKYITPNDCGLNPTYFDELTSTLENGTIPAYSIVIANTDGYILYEWNGAFFNENTTHQIFSVTKGIVGLLMGIAIDFGFIESVDVPISSYFNSSEWQNPDPRKEEITIRHLLTFTTGIEYDELSTPYNDPNNDFYIWTTSSDWVQFALDLPMNADPGLQFSFCTAASHLLSAILYKATNITTLEFANQYLFEPIGVNIGSWSIGSGGIHNGGNGITMTTQDMTRIGYLVLNNGTWNGTQIVSEEWIKETTKPQIHDFYGYQWWILPEEEFGKGAIYAAGAYTNKVILTLQEYGFVISVITGYGEGITADLHKKIVTDYLLPATLPYDLKSNTSDTTSSFYVLFILPWICALVISKKKKKYLWD
jgi:CubicO group peptidase (beta-lactamase class C family)